MKYYQIWFGKTIPAPYLVQMVEARRVIMEAGHTYELIHDKKFLGTPEAATIAKDLRVIDLCSVQDCAVIDCDIVPTKIIEPTEVGVYLGCDAGNPSISYIIVNGDKAFFEKMKAEKERRGISNVYGFTNKLLRDVKYNPIPADTYTHAREISVKTKNFLPALSRAIKN